MAITLLEASIPLSTLVYVLLGAGGTVALIALSIFLFKAASTVGNLGKLIKEIAPDVEETVEQLPAVTSNIEVVTGNLIDITDDLADSIPEVLDHVEVITGAVSESVDSLSSIISGLTGGAGALFGSKRRKSADPSTTQSIIAIAGAILGLINKSKGKNKKKKKK